jgi:hypothetical protein
MKKNIALTYNQARMLEGLVHDKGYSIINMVYYSASKVNNELVFFIDDFFRDDCEISEVYRSVRQKIIPLYISNVEIEKTVRLKDYTLPKFVIRDKEFEYYGKIMKSYQGDLALFMRPKREYFFKKMPETNRFEFVTLDGKEKKQPYLMENKYHNHPRIANIFDKIKLGINN